MAQLPEQHFTESDLQEEWVLFLQNLAKNNEVHDLALKTVHLKKMGEHEIEISYPSESVKIEFEKVQQDFFNHFKRKVNNYSITVQYKMDSIGLKKEIITKRTIFNKFVSKNPVLKDLDDLLKFDLNN